MFQKENCIIWKCLLVAFTFFNIKIVRGNFCLASTNISIVRVFRSGHFNDRFG